MDTHNSGDVSSIICKIICTAQLKKLETIIRPLAQKVYEHRQKNGGFVPMEVFEYLLGMSGVSVSVQTVNEVWNDGKLIGFALRKRDEKEMGDNWAGLYHSTCCTLRMLDSPANALERNAKETFTVPIQNINSNNVEFLGVTLHNEPERRSTCLTVMHRRKISTVDVGKFDGEWKIFSEANIRSQDGEIVDHNCYLLQWVLDKNRPMFADVRNGWST